MKKTPAAVVTNASSTDMPKPRPIPELPAAMHARLHEAMHALHAALEVEALWRAVQRLLRAAVPAHRVTLFLGHLGMGEARVVLTDPPIENLKEWYAERGKDNPFTPFIDAHRGTKFYRFEDVLPPRAAFVRTEFYKNFAKPEGWDKGVSFVFWTQREVSAMFSVYRSPKEPVITEAEMMVLHYLHPFIGTAIDRVQKLHTERLARRSLEEFNKHLPVGLVLVGWNLKAEFANHEGQRQCLLWNHGTLGARALNPRDAFAVPGPVLAACEGLRAAVQARNPKAPTPLPGDVASVAHALLPGLRAQVSVHNNPGSALARPRFLVVLDTRPGSAAAQVGGAEGESAAGTPGTGAGDRFGALRELTPREREIALLVCEGCSNAEIARRLSKSVLTIKTQLNSVFRKLGVESRTRLMAMLR